MAIVVGETTWAPLELRWKNFDGDGSDRGVAQKVSVGRNTGWRRRRHCAVGVRRVAGAHAKSVTQRRRERECVLL